MRSAGDVAAVFEPIYTSLPTPTRDGQVINYLADAANGVVWRFRYRQKSPSIYKWEFIGGREITAGYYWGGTVVTFSASAYVETLSTNGQLTLPLAGDYDIGLQTDGFFVTASNDIRIFARPTSGTSSATLQFGFGASASSSLGFERTNKRRWVGVAAGALAQLSYSSAAPSGQINLYGTNMWAVPVRVG